MPAQSFHLCAHSFSSLISESSRLKKGPRSSRGQHKWTNMPGNSLCNQKDLPAISTHETWYMQTDKNKHNNAFTDTATSIQILTGMHPVRASILTNAHKETHTSKHSNTFRRTQIGAHKNLTLQTDAHTYKRIRTATYTHLKTHTQLYTAKKLTCVRVLMCMCVTYACLHLCVRV